MTANNENLSVFTVLIEDDLNVTGVKIRASSRKEAEELANDLLAESVEKARKHPRVISIWHVEDRDV
jgi:hypothetical protein